MLFCGLEAKTVRWWLAERWSYFGGPISICHPTLHHSSPLSRAEAQIYAVSEKYKSEEAAFETEGSVCVGKKKGKLP